VTVRSATKDDLPDYIVMGRKFHESCPLHSTVAFDDEGFSEFYLAALENENLQFWIAEQDGQLVGICGAVAYGMYFNPAKTIVQELWWWITPEARGNGVGNLMFDAIENWSKEIGASALFMIALENSDVDQVSRIYARKGFSPMERTFFREVV